MAQLDEDAERLLALMNAAGTIDIASHTPQEVRDFWAARPGPSGRPVHAARDLEIPGPAGPIGARLYRPSGEAALPLLVYYHGGGMVLGSLTTHDWVCRELCLEAEALVLSIDYRLAPEWKFPAAIEDAYTAAVWAAANAARLGADPLRVILGGDSAGGTCAAVSCLLAKDRGGPAFRAQLLVYPGADRDLSRPSVAEFADAPILNRDAMLWFRSHYHSSEAELTDMRANPAAAADHSGLPPAFVLTAEIDPIRDAGEAYAMQLARAGVMTTLKRYRGVFHGFFALGPFMAKTTEAIGDAARFIRCM